DPAHPLFARRDGLPPLARLYPEQVYVRTRPGEGPTAVCACACGAAGTPTELAWVGERCGPCHDRAEEGRLTLEPPTAFGPVAGRGVTCALSGDGGLLAAASPDVPTVHLWDTRTGRYRAIRRAGVGIRDLAFVPGEDGVLAALAEDRLTF